MDYSDLIKDHARNPRNFGELGKKDVIKVNETNMACGDMVQMEVAVTNGKVDKVMWKGVGCAMMTASASLLSEWVVGKEVTEVKKMDEAVIVNEVVGAVNPGRMKCVMLPVVTLKKAL